jgi:hypothetical protein
MSHLDLKKSKKRAQKTGDPGRDPQHYLIVL